VDISDKYVSFIKDNIRDKKARVLIRFSNKSAVLLKGDKHIPGGLENGKPYFIGIYFNSNDYIQIYEIEDDWFYVVYVTYDKSKIDGIKTYKCDQWNGVVSLLKSIKII
jgi:hypothetical protein